MASFAEWTEQQKKKKKKEELTAAEQSAAGVSFTEYTKQVLGRDDIEAPLSERKKTEDIAPVKEETTEKKENDGDFWDWLGNSAMSGLASFNKAVTSTADVILGKPLQALGWENNPISSVADYYSDSYDQYKAKANKEADKLGSDKNIYGMGNGYDVAGQLVEGTVAAVPNAIIALMSMGTSLVGTTGTAIGGTSAALSTNAAYQSGNILTKVGITTQEMMKNPQFWTSFAQTYGPDYEEAIEEGADETTAALGATISSLLNAGVEIGIDGASGIQGLPQKVAEGGKSAVLEWVQSSLEEGGEGVVQGVISRLVAKTMYGSEEAVLDGQQMLMEGAMGTAVGALLGGGQIGVQSTTNAVNNAVQEAKAATLTENEQKVVDKIVETRITEEELAGKPVTAKEKKAIETQVKDELEKGYISIDTIEETLGGDTYKAYKDTVDSEDALQAEFDTLNKMKQGEMTGEQIDRRMELKQQLEELKTNSQREQLKTKLSDEVFNLAKDTRLAESYNEKARRGQAFEADVSKYDAKQQDVIQKAIDSGILNNTRRTHEFVDLIAKISADKGVSFDFTNNERLKESGFAVGDATINGFVTKDGVTLNIEAAKSLNSVVGHEISHVLEGTELYTELQNAVFEYAKTKGEYDSRLKALTELYEKVADADVNAELTADLVGDYLFTDADFVRKLSTEHRNVFQKIYDEVKYLLKIATAGSEEARQLEKVKKAFEDAYRGETKNTAEDGGAKYSLNEFSDGQRFVIIDVDQAQFDGLTVKEQTDLATKIIKERFQGKVIGLDNKAFVNGKTADEFTHPAKHIDGDIYQAKMRASTELDNLMDAGYGFRNKEDGEDGHIHSDAVGGFDYFDVIFKVGTEYYQGVINIKNNNRGKLLKDITKIRNITADMTSRYGENPSYAFLRDVSMNIEAQKEKNVNRQFSLTDNTGKELSKGQQDYFKDSKMRDDDGNLMVMYHGSQDAGFHTFDSDFSDDGRSFFFVDRNDVAASYSGTSETYEARTMHTAEDVNNFIAEIEAEGYEVVEKDGQFVLLYEGERVAAGDTAKGIYDEFRWYEGVGEGDANYKVYLNLTNPLVVDAKGKNWNNVSREYSQEIADRYHSLTAEEKAALTDLAEWGDYGVFRDEMLEARATAEQGGSGVFDEAYTKNLASAYEKLGGANANLYDAFTIASDNFSDESIQQFAVKQMNTRDYAKQAKEQGYDGVIFKNIVDNGGYSNGSEGASTVAIAFNSNQIKSTANSNPTKDADIRYSLSAETDTSYMDAVNRGDTETAQMMVDEAAKNTMPNSLVRDENGNLLTVYHGSPSKFTVFDHNRMNAHGNSHGRGFYFTEDKNMAEGYEKDGGQLLKGYLNIEKPLSEEKVTIKKPDLLKLIKATCEAEAKALVEDGGYDSVREALPDTWVSNYVYTYGMSMNDAYREVANIIYSDADNDVDIIAEVTNGGAGNENTLKLTHDILGYDGVIYTNADGNHEFVALTSNQFKSAEPITYDDSGNVIPLSQRFNAENEDIRYSLSRKGEIAPTYGTYNVRGEDIALETAPVAEKIAPVEDVAPTKPLTIDDMISAIQDKEFELQGYDPDAVAYAPATEEEASEAARRDFRRITDKDAPAVVERAQPEVTPEKASDPFLHRDWDDRKTKAFTTDNPDAKPFYKEAAEKLAEDFAYTQPAERGFSQEAYYNSNGEEGFWGWGRKAAPDINTLMDVYGLSYAQIGEGLDAIINDTNKVNNKPAKTIEFMLNDRLLKGTTMWYSGEEIPPHQGYIEWLNEQEHAKASAEDFASITDADAPIAPIAENVTNEPKSVAYEAIKPPKQTKEPRMAKATKAEQARAEEQTTAKVLTEEPTAEKEKGGLWKWAKNSVLDKGMVFEDLSLATGNRELQARWNSIRYADGKAQKLIGDGNAKAKSLSSIQEAVEKSGKTLQFYEYLYHNLNVDRMTLENRYADVQNKPVFGDNVTADASRVRVAALEKENPELKQYAKDVYDYLNYLREELVAGGVISRETADLWQEMYPHYVPIRRVGDEGLNINVPLDTGRTGVNAPIKRAIGGNRDILPLFDTMGQRTMQTFKAIAKNRFGVELKNTLGTTIESDTASIDDTIDSIDTQDGLLQEGKNGRKPTFTVFENGEKVTFEITDEMYDAMKPTSEILAKTIKPLNAVSNFRRATLTEYNPWFMLKNAVKDVQDVLINSQHATRTYAAIPKAIAQMKSKGKWYQEYIENGGEQNTYFDKETNTFTKENKVAETLKKITGLNAIQKANNVIEMLPRLAEYIASREAGRSVDVSMLDAARVTTNFAAGGDLTKAINRNGATFLNASVQGAIQQVRNIREAKHNGLKGWAKLAGTYVLAGLPAVLLNGLIWDDDEEYEELSDYVKQNYYIVGKYGDGKFVRIPKGRTVAVIQNAFEQMGNAVTGDDEVDLKTFVELVANNLAPNNPVENNIFSPIVQVMNNETWYGEDLVPTRLKDLPAAEQYDESTDSVSRWLGEATNTSPYKWNYLLDQYSGVIGDTFLPMMTPEAESGDNSFAGNMIAPLKDMFTTDSVMNNQNVSDFYDTVDELTTNAKGSNATDEDVLKYKYMNSVNSELGELYGQKREIQNSNLPDDEKYEAVRETQRLIDEMAAEALASYDGVTIADDYATVGDRHYYKNDEGEWTKVSDKQLEKQNEVTSELGIAPDEYWANKEEYDYAYKNPGKHAISKAVGGYEAYRGYTSELYDLKADKDENGETISGSAKEKKMAYIESLDLDYGQKLILHRSLYDSKEDKRKYNYAIVEYLDSREDISWDDMKTILEELDFTVYDDGRIEW